MKWNAGYRRAVALCAVVLGCGLTPIDAGAAPGKLVVVGGGKIGDEIRDTFIELAGGKGAKLLIVPQASGRPDAGERNAAPFIEKGMTNVSVLSLEDSDAAKLAVANASAIWFGGGAQNRLMERLEAAGVVDLIRKRHQSGVVMGGSSAGAVTVIDAREAKDLGAGEGEENSWKGVRLQWLRAGADFEY